MNPTIPTEVAAVLAEIFTDKDRAKLAEWEGSGTEAFEDPEWIAAAARADCHDKIESALTKAEAVPIRYVRWHPKHGYRWGDTHETPFDDLTGLGWASVPLYAHAPPAVSGRKPLSETMYRGPAHPEGHREQFRDRRCLAADNVPTESLGRDAEPDAVAEYVEDYEYCGETEDGRDACYTPNERERLLIEDAIRGWEDRTTAAEPVASVPDGWRLVPIEPTEAMDSAAEVALCGSIGGYEHGCWRAAYNAAMLAASPPTNQEGAAP